jgi:hypothetical protein
VQRGSDGKGSVRIVREPVSRWGEQFWYALEMVCGPFPPGTRLRSVTAKRLPNQKWSRRVVDPLDEQTAIATLMTWAEANGWRVIG